MIGSSRRRAALTVTTVVLAAALVGPSARADDQTLAQTLFDEAVKLMDQHRFAEACPKLAESQRLDPGGGTLIDLGICREGEGKLASAWAAYNEALSQAIQDNRRERENSARHHVEELEGKLAKLAIDLSEGARHTDQIEIRLDGTAVRQAAWGVLSPIDRGEHAIVVTAPGKREFHTSVNVLEDGSVQHVTIPPLEAAPVVASPEHGGTTRSSGQVVVGWVTAGLGVAVLGVGAVTGILAINDRQQSNSLCTFPGGQCTQQGFDLNEQAKTFAWISDFGVGIGAAAILGGILLVATAPKASVRIVPTVGVHGAGATFVATF